MSSKYSISTAWNITDGKDAATIISEIEKSNFSRIELNFTIPEDLLNELENIIFKKDIIVSSVHNFCPVPENMKGKVSPDYYSLASLKQEERKKAIEYTKKTVDTALRFGAKAVVLHAGRVEMIEYTKKLIEIYKKGEIFSDEYKQVIFEMSEERAKKAPDHISAVIRSLKEIVKYANRSGISIGLETRYYYREIPQFEEFEIIFDEISDANLFYWHDTGHAECSERLGITSHISFLRNFSYRMFGMHLHDVDGVRDHKLPGEGDFNFEILAPYINKDIIKVIEPHPPADIDKLKKSVTFLNKKIYNF